MEKGSGEIERHDQSGLPNGHSQLSDAQCCRAHSSGSRRGVRRPREAPIRARVAPNKERRRTGYWTGSGRVGHNRHSPHHGDQHMAHIWCLGRHERSIEGMVGRGQMEPWGSLALDHRIQSHRIVLRAARTVRLLSRTKSRSGSIAADE